MNRRRFVRNSVLGGAGILALGGGIYWVDHRRFLESELFQIIAPEARLHSSDLLTFLNSLSTYKRKSIAKTFAIEDDLKPEEILRELRWISSNIISYPFRDKSSFDYHAIVQWAAESLEIKDEHIASDSTFALEARIMGALFENLWDSLDSKQRIKLLEEIEHHSAISNQEVTISDKAAIASLGGSAALGVLSSTVYFTGFAFYSTMSSVLFTVAGFFGVTLPFGAYMGASTIVSILSGPVGWALLTIGALSGLALAGRANSRKTIAFIVQVHMLKIEKILSAGKERHFRRYLPRNT